MYATGAAKLHGATSLSPASSFFVAASSYPQNCFVMISTLVAPTDSELEKTKKFIYAWGHDIGNLTANLRGAYGIMSEMKSMLPAEAVTWIDLMETIVQQLDDASENVRTFSKTGQETHLGTHRIVDIVEPIIKIYQRTAGKDITIVLVNKSRVVAFRTDKLKLTHVLSNLIVNAIKFSPHHGTVILSISDAGNDVAFEVTDNGIGIPHDKIDEIFLPFVRLNEDYSGTGLGLANCKRYVDDLNGSISVYSIPHQQTTFKVLMPINASACESNYYTSKFSSTMKIKVEFFGPTGKDAMYSCSFDNHDQATGLIEMVLIDDQYCKDGPYSMRYTDSQGREIHTYKFCSIPPRTKAAFNFYNKNTDPLDNPLDENNLGQTG